MPEPKIYYVKPDGNDSNDGLSDATAWKTTTKVSDSQSIFNPGDVIMFKRGGFYCINGNKSINLDKSGTESQPITYTAYGEGDPPRFVRSNTISGTWTPLGDGRYQITTSTISFLFENYIQLKLARTNALLDGSSHISGGVVTYRPTNGKDPSENTLWRVTGNAVAITWYDTGTSTWHGGSHIVFDGLHFDTGVASASGVPFGIENITFRNCIFRGINYFYPPQAGNNFDGLTFENCIFENTPQYGLYLRNQDYPYGYIQNVVFRYNIFRNINVTLDPAFVGQQFFNPSSWSNKDRDLIAIQTTKNVLIENNLFISNEYNTGAITWWLRSGYASTGNIVRNNFFMGTCSQGGFLQWGGESPSEADISYHNNVVLAEAYTVSFEPGQVDTASDKILLPDDITADATPVILTSSGTLPGGLTAEKIYFIKQSTDRTGFQLTTKPYLGVVNITSTGSGTHYIKVLSVCIRASRNMTSPGGFFNNTILGDGVGVMYYSAPSNYSVKNNVIDTTYPICQVEDLTNMSLSNNCYGGASGNCCSIKESMVTLESALSSIGETNAVNADPQFVNPGGTNAEDYKIGSTSPCRMAGTDVGLSTDYTGRAWKNPPSIGAFEVRRGKTDLEIEVYV